ncbi:MAG: ATP-grasp domain-containing protein, partial [Proteobacteria bacterium]|nr:ATP-grasp domain-containing protein [Pseudomonadota bacterium]
MNIIYLSPNFPPNNYQFIQGLKNLGVNVLGIGETPYEHLNHNIKDSLTEYYKVNSLEDYDQSLRAVGFFTHKYGKVDRIFSLNEYWLEKEARLRTDFNVYGIKTDEIDNIRHKSRMKEKYKNAGINVAEGQIITGSEQATAFIKKVGYPVIVKPDGGIGAVDTYEINDKKGLEDFFKRKNNYDYIIEEFIDGDLYSFDGIADRDGKPVFYTSHFFNMGIMDAVNDRKDLFYYSLRDIPEDIKDAGIRTLKAFNYREGFFHLEFFRVKKNKKIIALEVNMRPPGGLTTDMFNFANDINIYQEWANVVVNN